MLVRLGLAFALSAATTTMTNIGGCAFADVPGERAHCGCHGFRRVTPERMNSHLHELGRRLGWCVKHGHVPAHDYIHLAERWFSDDGRAQFSNTNFVYGVAPWTTDGSPNAAGIPFTDEDDRMRTMMYSPGHNQVAKEWFCACCGAKVPNRPREWQPSASAPHKKEPHDWWWCSACRASRSKPSKQEMKRKVTAAECHKIDDILASKQTLCSSPA